MPMPMRRPMPMHMDNFADNGDPEGDGMSEPDADDEQAQMDELDQAANAGDQFAADSFFAPVDGASDAPPMDAQGGGAPQLTPEQLQQLLEMLKQQSGGMGGAPGGMPPQG